MNILLIGGTGVLSSAVACTALNHGDSVTVINRGSRKAVAGAEVIIADCHDYQTIAKKLSDRHFEVIVDFLIFNADDAKISFDFYKSRCSQYILISSCFVYDFSKGGILEENAPRGLACWNYSQGKCDAEDSLIKTAAGEKCQYTIIRPFVTYGNTRIPYSLAPAHGYDWTMIERAKAGKPIITWNDGSDQCNIMHVDDFCKGLYGLFLNRNAFGEAVNICSEKPTRWIDVIKTLEEVTGIAIPVINIPKDFVKNLYPQRKAEIDGRSFTITASNRKLKKLVPDFYESISLHDGIAKTVEAYRKNNYQSGIDWNYDAKCDAIINAWWKQNHVCKKLRFENYFGTEKVDNYCKYINSSDNQSFFFRVFRKGCNFGRKIWKKIK